uniref:Uncharacterized protein n=1 Tax=Cannabis sativa TaxID=3483 RepID=A0A803NVJ7_CANSA
MSLGQGGKFPSQKSWHDMVGLFGVPFDHWHDMDGPIWRAICTLARHMARQGFESSYQKWIWHGEIDGPLVNGIHEDNEGAHPPSELTSEQWLPICQFFTSSEFIVRSKINAENRKKMQYPTTQGTKSMAERRYEKKNKSNFIETWKEVHTKKSSNTFVNQLAAQKYGELVSAYIKRANTPYARAADEIEMSVLSEVLGERRGHNRGVGKKLKGQSSSRNTQPTLTQDMPVDPRVEQKFEKLTRLMLWMSQRLGPDVRLPTDEELFGMAMPQMSGGGSASSSQPGTSQYHQAQQLPPFIDEHAANTANTTDAKTSTTNAADITTATTSTTNATKAIDAADITNAATFHATDDIDAEDSTNAASFHATYVIDAANTRDAPTFHEDTTYATIFHATHTTCSADAADDTYASNVTFAVDAFNAADTAYAFDAIDTAYGTNVSDATIVIDAANVSHTTTKLSTNTRSITVALLSPNAEYSRTTVWRE